MWAGIVCDAIFVRSDLPRLEKVSQLYFCHLWLYHPVLCLIGKYLDHLQWNQQSLARLEKTTKTRSTSRCEEKSLTSHTCDMTVARSLLSSFVHIAYVSMSVSLFCALALCLSLAQFPNHHLGLSLTTVVFLSCLKPGAHTNSNKLPVT